MRSIDVCHRHVTTSTHFIERTPRALGSLRFWCFGGASRFTALHPLRRTDPCVGRVGRYAPHGTTASDHPPLSPPSPRSSSAGSLSRWAFSERGQGRFDRAPREGSSASSTRSDFHRSFQRRANVCTIPLALDEGDATVLPPRLTPRRRFTRRGLPLWAELMSAWAGTRNPVKGSGSYSRARRADDVDDRLLRHDTMCGHDPRKVPILARLFEMISKSRRRVALLRGAHAAASGFTRDS
jgi:hypothetical protein